MTCAQIREELSAWIDGQLPAEAAARVQAHVGGCARCAAELAALRAVVGHVRGLVDVPAPDLAAGVRRELARQPAGARDGRWAWLTPSYLRVLAATAVASAVLAMLVPQDLLRRWDLESRQRRAGRILAQDARAGRKAADPGALAHALAARRRGRASASPVAPRGVRPVVVAATPEARRKTVASADLAEVRDQFTLAQRVDDRQLAGGQIYGRSTYAAAPLATVPPAPPHPVTMSIHWTVPNRARAASLLREWAQARGVAVTAPTADVLAMEISDADSPALLALVLDHGDMILVPKRWSPPAGGSSEEWLHIELRVIPSSASSSAASPPAAP
jgi:hypothetical protein